MGLCAPQVSAVLRAPVLSRSEEGQGSNLRLEAEPHLVLSLGGFIKNVGMIPHYRLRPGLLATERHY